MRGGSADGTFVVQSSDTPGRPSGSSFTLTEYNVTASESAGGVTSSSKTRVTSTAGRETAAAIMPFRPHLDPRTAVLRSRIGRRTLDVGRARTVQSVRATRAAVGDQRTFHVEQGTITGVGGTCTPPQIKIGTSCYVDESTHLKTASTHAYVWVDDKIDASYGFTQADWDATGAAFDNDYARETAAFAPAFNAALTPSNSYTQCDSSGKPFASQSSYQPTPNLSGTSDQHVSILITNALENTGEGGYFDFLNDLNDPELNCAFGSDQHVPSNNLPMFVLGTDKYGPNGTGADENYWRTQDMPRSVPHEFQHYLHALNKVVVPDLATNCTNPNGCGEFDDSYVDEGDSMLAEDLVLGNGANPPQSPDSRLFAFDYMYTPGNYSLTAFAGYDVDPLSTDPNNATYGFFRSTAGNYGGAYLFARYLYDRFGGDAALHRVYATLAAPPANGANVAPIVAEANGESFAQVYGEFAGALAARNVATAGDPRFQFSSNVLLRGIAPFVIPGGATWNVRFNGPRSPEDLSSSTSPGGARIKLTPNGSVTAKLITGASLFFNVAPAGGAVVTGTVAGAPSLGVNGALVQGAYDDTGSCEGPQTGPNSCT